VIIKLNNYKMRKVFNLIIAMLILTSCNSQKTKLSFNLEKGKEYRQSIITKSTVIQDVNGKKNQHSYDI